MTYQKDNHRYDDLLNYKWTSKSLPNRMPMSQRAKIFLPFAALTGFNEALDKTLQTEITEMEVKPGESLEESC